jgi:hypothetical protein
MNIRNEIAPLPAWERGKAGFPAPWRNFFVWGVIGFFGLAGCSSPVAARTPVNVPVQSESATDLGTALATLTPTVTPTPADTATSTPTATPAILNPLTGLPVSDISLIQRRPLAVKVSSYPRTARPQAGLSYADLLFEFYQEFGMTRWQALYLSRDVEKVGPIRSGRRIDVPLMKAYQSLLVFCAEFSGTWSFMEFEDVRNLLLYVGPMSCPALCRDDSQISINGIYGNTSALRQQAASALKIPAYVPDLQGMVFSEEPPAMTGKASSVQVRFISDNAIAQWRYNPEDHKYYRWSETDKLNGEVIPQTDRLTNEQLSVSNLIVVYVNYIRRNGDEIYELELFGGGKALFFRDGMAETGVWRLPKIDHPLQFYGPDGPFYLKPGVTWIALVEDSSIETQVGDAWKVEFGMPGGGT